MKNYDYYKQDNQNSILELVQDLSTCQLLTMEEEEVSVGIFNPIYRDGKFYLHLNKSDVQLKTMAKVAKAKLVFYDFLCNVPSYWFDKQDGSFASSYYRFAEFQCEAKVFQGPSEVAKVCDWLLKMHQPEGGYLALSTESELYNPVFAMLGIAELKPIKINAKWKIGQNKSIEKRLEVIEKLKARNKGDDPRAAREIEKWLDSHPN